MDTAGIKSTVWTFADVLYNRTCIWNVPQLLCEALDKQPCDGLCDFSAVMKIFWLCGLQSAVLCLLHVRSQRLCMPAGCMSCRNPHGKKKAGWTSDSRLPFSMYVSRTDGPDEHMSTHSTHSNTRDRHSNAKAVYLSLWRVSGEGKKIIGLDSVCVSNCMNTDEKNKKASSWKMGRAVCVFMYACKSLCDFFFLVGRMKEKIWTTNLWVGI